MLQVKVVEKIPTHILYSITFSENRVDYEIMWKNMVEPDRPQMTIMRRMRFACWETKATNTHSEYEILLLFHGNNGFANAPLYYVTRVLPLFY